MGNLGLSESCLQTHLKNAIAQAALMLSRHPFWWVTTLYNEEKILFQSQNNLLWEGNPDIIKMYGAHEIAAIENTFELGGLNRWRLPTEEEMVHFVKSENNPLRKGEGYRLLLCWPWLIQGARIELDWLNIYPMMDGLRLFCNDQLTSKNKIKTVEFMLEKGWVITPALESIDCGDLLQNAKKINLNIDYLNNQEKHTRDLHLTQSIAHLLEQAITPIGHDFLQHLANSHAQNNYLQKILIKQEQIQQQNQHIYDKIKEIN